MTNTSITTYHAFSLCSQTNSIRMFVQYTEENEIIIYNRIFYYSYWFSRNISWLIGLGQWEIKVMELMKKGKT